MKRTGFISRGHSIFRDGCGRSFCMRRFASMLFSMASLILAIGVLCGRARGDGALWPASVPESQVRLATLEETGHVSAIPFDAPPSQTGSAVRPAGTLPSEGA